MPLAIVTALGMSLVSTIGVIAAPVAHADDPVPDDTATTTSSTSTTTTTTTAAPVSTAPPTPAPTTAAPTTTTPTTTTSIPAPTTTIAAPTTTVAPAPQNVIVYPSQIANILATIRYVESRGNYAAPLNKGRASGAYQFITSTWNNYGGYRDAYLAPPEIQDERAAADVNRFLAQWNNDVSMVPVMWYYPRAANDITLMDIVPVPTAGNVLTVREYQQRWLGVWAFLAGQPIPRPVTFADQLARMGLAPELPAPVAVDPSTPAVERTAQVAFPVLGPTRLAAPDCGDAQDIAQNAGASGSPEDIEAAGLCAEEAPGIIFGVKMQPVLAVVDGVITEVVDTPGANITVTITDTTGRSFELAGFNDDNPGTNDGAAPPHLRLTRLAVVGQSVRAGQVLGFMGDTDPLPLGIRSDVPTDATVEIPDRPGCAAHPAHDQRPRRNTGRRVRTGDRRRVPASVFGGHRTLVRSPEWVGPRPGRDRDHRRQPRDRLRVGDHLDRRGDRLWLGGDDLSERELRVGATGQAGPRRRRADIDSGQLDDTDRPVDVDLGRAGGSRGHLAHHPDDATLSGRIS